MIRTLPWQTPARNYYPLPKVLCQLGLSPGEIAVYSFLMYCENRTTYQCYPSYRTIGEAVGMSRNTVAKYVRQLEEKGLIRTERTTVTLKDGRKRNGSLLYTILPPEQAVEQVLAQHNQHQLHLAEMAAERHRAQQKLTAQNDMMRGGEVV
jgi:predicted transcriptional regulator